MSLQNSHDISTVKIMLKEGAQGDSIVDISKTSTSGLVDTYTITMSSGRKYYFTVTNGDNAPEVNAILNVYGSKNLNAYPYVDTSKVEHGVTFTDNGDGTFTADGTNAIADDAASTFVCNSVGGKGLYVKNGTYTMTGAPSGSSSSTYFLFVVYKNASNQNVYKYDYGEGVTFTINGSYGDPNGAYLGFGFTVSRGETIDNKTVYPMIRDARISDDTYEPFAMTNKQITDKFVGGNVMKYKGQTSIKKNGDGVKTVSALLDELHTDFVAYLASQSDSYRCKVYRLYFNGLTNYAGAVYKFMDNFLKKGDSASQTLDAIDMSSAHWYIYHVALKSSGSVCVKNTDGTIENFGSNVLASTGYMQLYLDEYELV